MGGVKGSLNQQPPGYGNGRAHRPVVSSFSSPIYSLAQVVKTAGALADVTSMNRRCLQEGHLTFLIRLAKNSLLMIFENTGINKQGME